MNTVRFFDGARRQGRIGVASEIMRIEILKKGKLPTADRYKSILKKKFSENKEKALAGKVSTFSLPGSIKEARALSKRAEHALQQIAEKKAKKEAKALRHMVIVEERRFPNGNITKKGKIYDVAGNLVAQVNTKTGKMATTNGWSLGKYKPRSYFTNLTIQNAITQHSPYFINLRKQQLLEQQGVQMVTSHGVADVEVINVHGSASNPLQDFTGVNPMAPRQNVGLTSWGVRSDNVWGSFTDNSWGTFADNVWGGNMSDVWGGIGAPGMWGQRGPNIWNTGSGRNYLRHMTGFILALFGVSDKKNREKLRRLNSGAAARASAQSRTAAPTRSAPTGRR